MQRVQTMKYEQNIKRAEVRQMVRSSTSSCVLSAYFLYIFFCSVISFSCSRKGMCFPLKRRSDVGRQMSLCVHSVRCRYEMQKLCFVYFSSLLLFLFFNFLFLLCVEEASMVVRMACGSHSLFTSTFSKFMDGLLVR